VKEYTPTLAALAALSMILAAVLVLSLCGGKETIIAGLVTAAVGMSGAIAGMSNQQQRKEPPPTISDSPGAVINPNPNEPAR
jgi:hypothetical protein